MKQITILSLFILLAFTLNAQERPLNTGLGIDEQYSFVGMMLTDVIERYGPPRAVAAARGIELWQDDVVFQYTGVEFFIYRDRIWQVKFASTHGISNGDPKAAVLLTLGEKAEDMGDYVLMSIENKNWPLMMRVNFNETRQVNAIFIYRPDF